MGGGISGQRAVGSEEKQNAERRGIVCGAETLLPAASSPLLSRAWWPAPSWIAAAARPFGKLW